MPIRSRVTSSSEPSVLIRRAVLGRDRGARGSPRGLFAGAELEHLAEQDENRDDGGRLEVDRHRAVHAAEGRGNMPGATVATTL